MRLLISLGGNALLHRGDAVTADNQRESAAHAAMWLASVVRSHEVVITHGNGPQLGLLALQSFSYVGEPSRLDFLGAEAGGMIGYLLERELRNQLGRDHLLSTLLAQVIVDPQDPAFAKPTKSIGPFYERTHAHQLRQARGWEFAEFDGQFRRLVAAPRPLMLLETRNVEILLQAGSTVIASGPVPVATLPSGGFQGVEALPDKDTYAALLARELNADAFIMLTDVLAAAVNFGKPDQRQIRRATPAMLRAIEFDQATMGPKIEAGCGFVDATGKWAAIGALSDVSRVLCGEAGTRIVGSFPGKMEFWDN
ncbi:MAG: carbamate kinase [Rhizobiaceae bacterium]|nr:MAG: carbamate kinase [Rhizobiaceae bacterium]